MAHDFLGNELSLGDDAVFLNYNGTSASLERGKITRVSEHTAEISGKRRAEYKIIKVNPVKPTMDNTWIPCSERLPKDEESVLTYKNGIIEVQEYEKRRNGWVSGGWFWSAATVTHWMPLPELPEEGGNGNAAD